VSNWLSLTEQIVEPVREDRPCKHGHISGRYAHGHCKECHRLEKQRNRVGERAEKDRATMRKYIAAHKTGLPDGAGHHRGRVTAKRQGLS